MIVDLDSVAGDGGGGLPRYDVCIVGSGPAGGTVARELLGSGLRVVVLESGRRKPTALGDALRQVRSEGIEIKDYSRERVLGGASTTWAGLSSPLDPIDFEERSDIGRAGWPLTREELMPWYARASERYRFAPLPMFAEDGFARVRSRGDVRVSWRDLEEKVFLACAEPQDFGREWTDTYAADGTDLYLDASVVRLESAGAGETPGADESPGSTGAAATVGERRIRRAVVRTRSGHELAVEADAFVLATGGLENARLLLLSQDLCPAGLGNEHDQVGRCLMNHPKNYFGVIELTTPLRELPHLFGCLTGGYAGYAGLRLTEAQQRARGVLNSYIRFEPLFPWSGREGVEAFVYLVKRSGALMRAWKRGKSDEVVTLRDYSETGDDSDLQNERKTWTSGFKLVWLVLVDLPWVARYVFSRLFQGRSPLIRRVRLRHFMEMEPHPDNRVTLGDERDAHGQPVTVVRHDSTALDRRSMVAVQEVLADEVARTGLGSLAKHLAGCRSWPITTDASHHMGTTRMGIDPAASVVDTDGRVHGVENVFVVGASVLPTSGCANPTFTLVALAMRQAHHLRTAVFGRTAAAHLARSSGSGDSADSGEQADSSGSRGGRVRVAPVIVPPPCAADAPAPSRRALVIGAGTRVTTDVLPALACLPDLYEVAGVFARAPRTVSAAGREFAVRGLDTLSPEDLTGIDLVHVAVSKTAIPSILKLLAERAGAASLARVHLQVDTPPLEFRDLKQRALFAPFGRVSVAEDCITLPWLDAVSAATDAGLLGELREAVFDRSAWRYHALALTKTLFGAPVVRARRRRVNGTMHWELRFAGGGKATIIEPRDYAAGRFVLVGRQGSITDDPESTAGALLIEPVVEAGLCVGFRVGDRVTRLDAAESAVIGPMRAGERITARTDDFKRCGLLRLYRQAAAGRPGYSLDEALDDVAIDRLSEKLRLWVSSPLTSVRGALGRRVVGLVARLGG